MKAIAIFSVVLLTACSAIVTLSYSQSAVAPSLFNKYKFGAAVSGGHYRYDPGFAIELTVPTFLARDLSLKIKGSIQWLEAYKALHGRWIGYRTFGVAVVYSAKPVDRLRFYTELGFFSIFPDIRFSEKRYLPGIYQFNGLEIGLVEIANYMACLYVGVGPAFAEAYADKLEGKPRYGSGMLYLSGVRFYF